LAIIDRPGWYSAAVWLDEAGLRERAVTALENTGTDTEISRCQCQDALRQIRKFHPEDQPYKWSAKRLRLLAGAGILVLVLTVIPNPKQLEADRQQAVRREAAQQKHKIEKVRKEMEKANAASPAAEREKAIESLKELEKELERTRNLNQGLKALAHTEDQLLKLQNPRTADAEQLAAALKQQEMTRDLGRKITNGDVRGSREETEKILNQAAAMKGAQRQVAAQQISRSANNVAPVVSQLLRSLAAAVSSGQGASASPALLNQLSAAAGQAAAISAMNQGMAATADARQGLLAAAGNTSSQLAVNGASGNVEAVPCPAGAGQEGGSGNNAGAGSTAAGGNTPGSQGGNSSGQGSKNGGSGQGSGGGGAGQGSGSGSENRGNEAAANSGSTAQGQADMKFKDYEKVFDPSFINSQGEDSQLRGRAGNGPEQSVDTNEPLPERGGQRPYKEVAAQYGQRAREALDRSSIPPGMAEIVKGYFSSLEE
jgi:hypothetical protein